MEAWKNDQKLKLFSFVSQVYTVFVNGIACSTGYMASECEALANLTNTRLLLC